MESQLVKMPDFDPDQLNEFLASYYSKLFPTYLMHKWLSYGDGKWRGFIFSFIQCWVCAILWISDSYFARREFSFTLPGDIYIRFQSFNNSKEFEAELLKKQPEKIDIGAVYTQKPKHRDSSGAFQPESKE